MTMQTHTEWTDLQRYFARTDAEVWSAGIFGPRFKEFGDRLLNYLDTNNNEVPVQEWIDIRKEALGF